VKTRTVKKITAAGHVIKVRDWGWSDTGHRVELNLDGFYLVVTDHESLPMLKTMADNLAFALKAPERKKKRPKPVDPKGVVS
jgi:hypothetical protein